MLTGTRPFNLTTADNLYTRIRLQEPTTIRRKCLWNCKPVCSSVSRSVGGSLPQRQQLRKNWNAGSRVKPCDGASLARREARAAVTLNSRSLAVVVVAILAVAAAWAGGAFRDPAKPSCSARRRGRGGGNSPMNGVRWSRGSTAGQERPKAWAGITASCHGVGLVGLTDGPRTPDPHRGRPLSRF